MTDLTKTEQALAATLLDLAADQFGNHGCNDFRLDKAIPDPDERRQFVRAMHEWNGDLEEAEEEGWLDGDNEWEMDWYLMNFLAARLRGEK